MTAWSRASSSSVLPNAVFPWCVDLLQFDSRLFPFALGVFRIRAKGASTPRPTQIRFFSSWPMISFLRARKAAIWLAEDVELRSSDNIGGVVARAMVYWTEYSSAPMTDSGGGKSSETRRIKHALVDADN